MELENDDIFTTWLQDFNVEEVGARIFIQQIDAVRNNSLQLTPEQHARLHNQTFFETPKPLSFYEPVEDGPEMIKRGGNGIAKDKRLKRKNKKRNSKRRQLGRRSATAAFRQTRKGYGNSDHAIGEVTEDEDICDSDNEIVNTELISINKHPRHNKRKKWKLRRRNELSWKTDAIALGLED